MGTRHTSQWGHRLRQQTEITHLQAIRQLGSDTKRFSFEFQLMELENREGPLHADRRRFLESLRDTSPSRYEILLFLQLYVHAIRYHEVARAKLAGAFPFLPARLVVVTDPGMSVWARTSTSLIDDHIVVFISLGLARIAEFMARVLALVYKSHRTFFDPIATPIHARQSSEYLEHSGRLLSTLNRYRSELRNLDLDGRPKFEPTYTVTGSLDVEPRSAAHQFMGIANIVLMAFFIHHEAAHANLGHDGTGAPATRSVHGIRDGLTARKLSGECDVYSESLVRECEADALAVTTMWDGMAFDDRLRITIETSCCLPFAYLGCMEGFMLNRHVRGLVSSLSAPKEWHERARSLISFVAGSMLRAGLASETVFHVVHHAASINAASVAFFANVDNGELLVADRFEALASVP